VPKKLKEREPVTLSWQFVLAQQLQQSSNMHILRPAHHS